MVKHCDSCICGEGKPKCSREFCETPDSPVTFAPDPFRSEVHGDETPIWECKNCRYESGMEI